MPECRGRYKPLAYFTRIYSVARENLTAAPCREFCIIFRNVLFISRGAIVYTNCNRFNVGDEFRKRRQVYHAMKILLLSRTYFFQNFPYCFQVSFVEFIFFLEHGTSLKRAHGIYHITNPHI